eukprot:6986941-Prymnesium_polylepis.2
MVHRAVTAGETGRSWPGSSAVASSAAAASAAPALADTVGATWAAAALGGAFAVSPSVGAATLEFRRVKKEPINICGAVGAAFRARCRCFFSRCCRRLRAAAGSSEVCRCNSSASDTSASASESASGSGRYSSPLSQSLRHRRFGCTAFSFARCAPRSDFFGGIPRTSWSQCSSACAGETMTATPELLYAPANDE